MAISPEDPANGSSDRLSGPSVPRAPDVFSVKTAVGFESLSDGKRTRKCRHGLVLLAVVTTVVLLTAAGLLLLHYRHGTTEEEVVPAGNNSSDISDWCPVEVPRLNDTSKKIGEDAVIIPCASAEDYNDEVMRQTNEGLRAAEWSKGADGRWTAAAEGGERAFMRKYLHFVLAVANVSSETLTLAQLEGLFKEDIGLLQCLGTEQLSIEDLRFACSMARVDAPVRPHIFTDTLQSKAMLVALSLGDYRDALQEFVGRRKDAGRQGVWMPVATPFDAFFELAKSNDHKGMAAFLDEPARHGESLRQLYTHFFRHWRAHCFVDRKPKETRDWQWSSHFVQCFRSAGSDLADEQSLKKFVEDKERMHKEEVKLKEWKKIL